VDKKTKICNISLKISLFETSRHCRRREKIERDLTASAKMKFSLSAKTE
jgi:hypothetical protein